MADSSIEIIKEGRKYDIPIEGSLGLLALGAVGLKAWRKVRREAQRSDMDTLNNVSNG